MKEMKMATRNGQAGYLSIRICEPWVKPKQQCDLIFGKELGEEKQWKSEDKHIFIFFVVNFKFFALANFAGLLECQKALLDSPTHSGSLKVILMSFKMRWLNCILLCYTLESSICSILIKMRESWRWLPYLVLLFWKHFFRIPAYVQLKLSWMNTCHFLQKLYFWLYSIYVREKWENSDEEKKSLLSSVVLRWSKVSLFMQ